MPKDQGRQADMRDANLYNATGPDIRQKQGEQPRRINERHEVSRVELAAAVNFALKQGVGECIFGAPVMRFDRHAGQHHKCRHKMSHAYISVNA